MERENQVFYRGMDHGIQKVVKEGPFARTHEVNRVILNKTEKDLTKDDKENM